MLTCCHSAGHRKSDSLEPEMRQGLDKFLGDWRISPASFPRGGVIQSVADIDARAHQGDGSPGIQLRHLLRGARLRSQTRQWLGTAEKNCQ
jgi:hypothetical protein